MFVLVFVCLTFNSWSIALFVRERAVQPTLDRSNLFFPMLHVTCRRCRPASLSPLTPHPTHRCRATSLVVLTAAFDRVDIRLGDTARCPPVLHKAGRWQWVGGESVSRAVAHKWDDGQTEETSCDTSHLCCLPTTLSAAQTAVWLCP